MRRQRAASHRPALAIEDQPVNLYRSAQEESNRTVVFQPADTLPPCETPLGTDVRFRVRNVGAGSALEVEARWEFDAIEFAAVVARADPEAGRGISTGAGFVQFEAKGYGSWMARLEQVRRLGTMSSSDPLPVDVPMPFVYVWLASALFQAVLVRGLEGAMQLELPLLTLCISYRDRSRARLESRYRILFDLIFLSEGADPTPESPGWSNIGAGIFTVRAA